MAEEERVVDIEFAATDENKLSFAFPIRKKVESTQRECIVSASANPQDQHQRAIMCGMVCIPHSFRPTVPNP